MDALLNLDVAVFRWINQDLVHPWLDLLCHLLGGHYLTPVAIALGVVLAWRGKLRGRVCLILLLLAVAITDGGVVSQLKHALARPRPPLALDDVRLMLGVGRSYGMPSAHAANWFCAATVLFFFYRRSRWVLFPLAAAVAFGRVYAGVHYPSDVLVGAIVGMGCGAVTLWGSEWLWREGFARLFPLWHARCPTLVRPELRPPVAPGETAARELDEHWIRLGWLLLALFFVLRLFIIGSSRFQLSEDEAYQWLWSKHLDLSYYSKPPLIAYAQFLGTSLLGDSAFGIRFLSPVMATLMGAWLLRFFVRELRQPRAGFWLIPIAASTPLLLAGSLLMTIDPLSVFFWTAAMLAGWKAIQGDSTAGWVQVGCWVGLGVLSKYTNLFQWVSFALFLALWPAARAQWRRPGPYLALALSLLALLPVLLWNAQHDWITLTHLAERGGLDRRWQPTLRFFGEFVGAEVGLLNPVFAVAMTVAVATACRRHRHDPVRMYFLSMGAPLFLFYLLYSFRSRVLPNWIAPTVIPLFCLMVLHWTPVLERGAGSARRWLGIGIAGGLLGAALLQRVDMIPALTGYAVPPKLNPMRRVGSWASTAALVESHWRRLQSEGKPAFLIGDHYGITGLLSFYLPEARAALRAEPLVYFRTTERPQNQFWFWPGYTHRKGQNALFVMEVKERGQPAPILAEQFSQVRDLGVFEVEFRGLKMHRLHLFECRDLR